MTHLSTTSSPTVASWLELAAAWRFASLMFQTPSDGSLAELRALTSEVPEAWRDEARALAAFPPEDWSTEFHRVLGPGGCPASESSYDDNALAGRGPLLARVAGFYDAFAYRPYDVTAEVPDHASVELGFLSYLALKCAYATYDRNDTALDVTARAYHRFIDEHLRWWCDRFAERLEAAESALFAGAGAWTRRVMMDTDVSRLTSDQST